MAWRRSMAYSPFPPERMSRRRPVGRLTRVATDWCRAVARRRWSWRDGDHISTPNVDGPARSIGLCLKNGGLMARQIGYVNAHATSTLVGDSREAEAIAQVFGDYRVPVTSTKSQTGHEMWMAGASELIYSILMMKNDFIAGNINFERPDEKTACLNIVPETRECHFDLFLSNSFGFGGTNSTLVVRNM